MPCMRCANGRWKWGDAGNCVFENLEHCQRAERAIRAENPGLDANHAVFGVKMAEYARKTNKRKMRDKQGKFVNERPIKPVVWR